MGTKANGNKYSSLRFILDKHLQLPHVGVTHCQQNRLLSVEATDELLQIVFGLVSQLNYVVDRGELANYLHLLVSQLNYFAPSSSKREREREKVTVSFAYVAEACSSN